MPLFVLRRWLDDCVDAEAAVELLGCLLGMHLLLGGDTLVGKNNKRNAVGGFRYEIITTRYDQGQ